MEIKQTAIQVIILLVVPILIIVGYWQFRSAPADESVSAPGQDLLDRGAKVREALAIIDRIRFDNSLFSIPTYATLEDQTVPIVEERLGREEPFVPSEEVKKLTPQISVPQGQQTGVRINPPSRAR